MVYNGKIDSLNFSSENLEKLFNDNESYSIKNIKGVGTFEPGIWRKTFHKPLTRNIVEAKILYTSMGLMLAIKRYSRSPTKQVIEFAGLQGYNERSKYLRELLKSLMEHIQDNQVVRIDVAIDFKDKIPNSVIKILCNKRKPFRYWNTTYYKSRSEKKINNHLNIKIYNKSRTKNNTENIQRLEFSFPNSYLKKIKIKDLDKSFKKMEKTIKRFSGLNVKILSL